MRYYVSSLQGKKASLQEKAASLKEEYTPMKFRLKREEGVLSVEIKFYDLTGKTTNKTQIEIAGGELFIDVSVVRLGEGAYLFFPFKVFTDEIAPIDGVPLCGEYDDAGFPAIYEGSLSETGEELCQLFAPVKDGTALTDRRRHGNAVHDMKELSGFKEGFVYGIVCHPHTGAVEAVMGGGD